MLLSGDRSPQPQVLAALADARAVRGRAGPAIRLAVERARQVPAPGGGRTLERWEWLAGVSAADLTAGRVAEAHLDALAILTESGCGGSDLPETGASADADADADAGSSWGVFAAEGPGLRVDATETASDTTASDTTADDAAGEPVRIESQWHLTGTKPWCSLAGQLSHALVTAHVPGGRRLFAVSLRTPQVRVHGDGWFSRGLAEVPSGPIDLTDAAAVPVGATDWYLTRPGFAWGGMGVAACWYGGAVGIARTLWSGVEARPTDVLARAHLGAVDAALHRSRVVLADAARVVDAGQAAGAAGVLLAARVRDVVASAAEEIILRSGHALGPGPLVGDEEHARRVADLTVYVRQHHAERDQAALGALLQAGEQPW